MPREIDDILEDADDVRLPEWKKVGDFEILESTLGLAVIHDASSKRRLHDEQPYHNDVQGLVRYADHVAIDLGGDTLAGMRRKCESALRDRPVTMKTLDLDEEEKPRFDPIEEAADADPFTQQPEPPKQPPRRWGTTPITSGDDD
jgi:hypothetical protein